MEKMKKFDNGLRLVYKKIDGMYSTALGIWVGAGSSDETKENNGISHFIEHMLFKGTKNRTSFEITDSVDRIGAQINAFTSKECTCYYTKSMKEHVEKSFDILSDMFFNSLFDKVEMQKEKGVICEEISMVEDIPDEICIDCLCECYFGDNSLGKTIIGTAKNVQGFTREDVDKYMKAQYNPKNIVISIAGNIDEDDVIKFAEKYFYKNFNNNSEFNVQRTMKHNPSNNFAHRFKSVEQSHIAIAFESIPFGDINTERAVMISNILGGGMSSRLFQSVREDKGLAYSVYSYVSNYKNNGLLTVYAGINPKNVFLCVDTIKKEIDKMIKKGITKDEFQRAKEQMKGTFVMSQEATASVMTSMGKYMTINDRLYNMQEKLDTIEKVDYDSLIEYLKGYFNFKTTCASYVGPKIEEYKVLDYFLK